MDTLLDICMAIGVGAAAGLAPFVAVAATVVLVSLHVGVNPEGSSVDDVASAAFVVVAALLLLESFASSMTIGGLRIRVAADRPIATAIFWAMAVVMGGLAGLVVYQAAGHEPFVGTIAGVLSASVVALGWAPFFARVSARVGRTRKGEDAQPTDGRVLAVATDGLTVVAVLLALLLPPTGLILPVLAGLLMIGRRRQEGKKYEGLRSLR